MSHLYLTGDEHLLFFAVQGSQNQFKEVWEEADGLDPEDFDPKTFFKLHGKSSSIDIIGWGRDIHLRVPQHS